MEELRKFASQLYALNSTLNRSVPSVVKTRSFVDSMVQLLFPVKSNNCFAEKETELELERCYIELKELLYSLKDNLGDSPEGIADGFASGLAAAHEKMVMDARCIEKYDPAASGIEEIILGYPGFYCIVVYRLAHLLHELGVPYIPRIMMEYVHEKTGIDIHPGASIDSPFFIDHGTGIVIGETTRIGKNVRLFQGVTLGALSVEKDLANTKRHPTIEDGVVIYAGSTILGGKTVIGHDSVLGGNTWITESVPAHSVVYRQHRVIIKDSKDFKAPLDWVI